MKNQISIDYLPDGDMLSVTFGEIGHKGQGFELNDHIYIRIDRESQQPLGLTFLSYSKLIKLGDISLSFWNDFPQEVKQILLKFVNNLLPKIIGLSEMRNFSDLSLE